MSITWKLAQENARMRLLRIRCCNRPTRYVRKLLSYRPPVLVFHSAKARAKADVLAAASIAFPHNIPNGFCVNTLTVCFHVSRRSVCCNIKKPFPFLSLLAFSLNCLSFIERLSIIAIELSASALSRIIPAYAGSTKQ